MFSFRKRKKKKSIKQKIEELDDVLYLQINQYRNRADTKYHRGIIDGLNSVRSSLNKILEED